MRRGGPPLPDDIAVHDLDRAVRVELGDLPRPAADRVARHLVAAGRLLDVDPPAALAHAQAARTMAPRIGAVREATGLAAYHAGQWRIAAAELRAYQRISGDATHAPVLADCERALGRPDRALEVFRSATGLPPAVVAELRIVAAGAYRDLGDPDAARTLLEVPELTAEPPPPFAARLRYAYADALRAGGRDGDAREWFARALDADQHGETAAADRLLELDGVVLAEAAEPERRVVDGYDLVILDLDGVVYVGEDPIDQAAEAVAQLRAEGVPVLFATNNASRTPVEVSDLLDRIGIPATPAEVLTSADAAAELLAADLAAGAPVLVVGAEALAAEITRVGLLPVRSADEAPAAVVQGYGRSVGWPELAEASLAIQAGARWVVTNRDLTLPAPRGVLPGNGALVAALAAALGREPDLVVGKPSPALFRAAAARAGASRPLVVGDRLDTDIQGARAAEMDSLLVLTGVTGEAEAAGARPAAPTYQGADLSTLFAPAGNPAGAGSAGAGPDRAGDPGGAGDEVSAGRAA